MNHLWKRACTFLLGLVAGLLLAELVLRAADGLGWIPSWQEARRARTSSIWMKSPHPELIYQHRPGYVKDGVRLTDRHGILRGDDATVEKPPETFRISVLGDSIAAGLKISYEERFTTRLEHLAARIMGRPVEVLNFGVNGYGTAQEAVWLETHAGRFETDALVLQYCMNDLRPSATPSRWFLGHTWYVADLVGELYDRRFVHGYPPASYWPKLYRDEQGWRSVVHGFEMISDYAEKQGVPAVLVIFPVLSKEGWWAGEARERHALVASVARSVGFEVVDLLETYSEHSVEALRFEPWDTLHPNDLGHEIAAGAIARKLAGLPGIESSP